MNSIVLELQRELLKEECDVLQALRKAHVIAKKLSLADFDLWIDNELNGYKHDSDNIPQYRQMKGDLKAKNPRLGWIPAVITGPNGQLFNTVPIYESISALIKVEKDSKEGYFCYSYPAPLAMEICKLAGAPTYMEISLHISTYRISEVIEQVKNRLLEWTLTLEAEGIIGKDMSFNDREKEIAQNIPQQNIYYGTVINGNVSNSQVVSGNNNSTVYNADGIKTAIGEILSSIQKESISQDDMESALELLNDISTKLDQNKKPGIIKSALIGLKDFILSAGANVTASLITAKIQELF